MFRSPPGRDSALRARGQYNIRDTFISLALSAGEDPGWVARVCGTSEEMIFRHYRGVPRDSKPMKAVATSDRTIVG